MDETEGLDLKRPEYSMDSYIPNSKSSDLIKPNDDESRKPLSMKF